MLSRSLTQQDLLVFSRGCQWIRTVSSKRKQIGLPRSKLFANQREGLCPRARIFRQSQKKMNEIHRVDGPDMYLHRAAYPELYLPVGRSKHKKQ